MRRSVVLLIAVSIAILASSSAAVASSSSSNSGGRPGGNYVACNNSDHVDELGMTWNYANTGRSALHADVAWVTRHFDIVDQVLWDETRACIAWWLSVRDWRAMKDQSDCHQLAAVLVQSWGTGPTWDYEGHRTHTRNRWTWTRNRCNW